MFKDTFEIPGKAQSRPQSVSEQIFWRIVNSNGELKGLGDQLKAKGHFRPVEASGASYIRYEFLFKGQTRRFEAQITGNTNAVQVKNFLTTCQKGTNGTFDQPNIAPYLPASRRPL